MTDSLREFGSIAIAGDSPNADRASAGLTRFSSLVQRLSGSLTSLERAAKPLRLKPLAGRDWFDLLTRKLVPQLADGAYLIVAVVGGTNIGKSVVFNHIAGFRASASSPLASGTKHPVCLVPTDFAEQHDLHAMFPAFELRSWTSGDEALQSSDAHCLFWRTHDSVPKNLVILDTPDVDSDAPVNWQRADAVRQAADVLVAVLTQQKYNDAAVKQFFRKAASEDKAAIIVFNQVELPDDEPYWPIWLNTFCGETGLKPEYVYLAENNRKAAEAIALKFEERRVTSVECRVPEQAMTARDVVASPLALDTQHSALSTVLSQLRFAEIKLRTLRGSLTRLVDVDSGVPAYLREVATRSRQFRDASDVFASRAMVKQADWPAPPNGLLVDEMWSWWDGHREAWTASVHGFYAHLGRWLTGGVRLVRDHVWGAPPPPLDEYRKAEWDAIVRVLEQVYGQLQVITTLGNELLTSRLERLLSGTSCEAVLAQLHREHDQFDFAALAKRLVHEEMSVLKTDRQQLFTMLRQADRAAAVFRPALTLLLAMGGGFGADHLIAEAATQTLTHVAIDTTGAAATTVAGEAVVETAGGVLGQAKAWLLQLHTKFKAEREAWLLAKLREHLLGELLDELQAGANVPESSAFSEVEAAVTKLSNTLNQVQLGSVV